jgi:hypothetical protein
MPALADRAAPHRPPGRTAPGRPRLRAVAAPRRRRVPRAGALALYALGLTAGFLLGGLASLPAGGEVAGAQIGLAVAAAAVCGLAATRARAVARRRRAAVRV